MNRSIPAEKNADSGANIESAVLRPEIKRDRPAEREAQMIAVDKVCGRCGFLGEHLRDLVRRKAIGPEISEAPPGIAEARFDGRRHLVGFGRLLLPSNGLKDVAEGPVKIGGARRRGQELAI
jgi:hypothetical protein